MALQAPAPKRYPNSSGLLASSAGLGWSKFSAELRSHEVCEIVGIVPQSVELCLVVAANDEAVVRRSGEGPAEEAAARRGAIWLSPAGIGKDIAISARIPATMHVYLPSALFESLRDDFNLPARPANSIRYVAGIRDELIENLGQSILFELTEQTTAGRMYVETAAMTLGARLLQKYCDDGARIAIDNSSQHLDSRRVSRVLDYIGEHMEEEITLDRLASVAGLSLFHFTRMFTRTMGVPPSRYVSQLRLEQARVDIAAGKLSLAEIALKAGFSSQASFTRAFNRTTGVTPGEYRSQVR